MKTTAWLRSAHYDVLFLQSISTPPSKTNVWSGRTSLSRRCLLSGLSEKNRARLSNQVFFQERMPILNHRWETSIINKQLNRSSYQVIWFWKEKDFKNGASLESTLSRLQQNRITGSSVDSSARTKTSRFQEALLDFFASHPIPLSLVESSKFKNLFAVYDIDLPIKSRPSLSSKMKERGF